MNLPALTKPSASTIPTSEMKKTHTVRSNSFLGGNMKAALFIAMSTTLSLPVFAQGFAGGLVNGLQQGMQLRMQQQQMEMMKKAAAQDEELRRQQQQASDQLRLEEIQRDISTFMIDHPQYLDQDRLAELKAEVKRLRGIPENQGREIMWLLDEGHTAISLREDIAKAKLGNADLIHWEDNNPAAWDEALRQDEILRSHPQWSSKPHSERLAEVARRVRAIMPSASTPVALDKTEK